mgnify:CR=1 FL=1|jgi:hypothetical protein|tara:strand:- start:8987 stop:9214 length:228 start_codon:yes stop_codon:yes gene_type:complete
MDHNRMKIEVLLELKALSKAMNQKRRILDAIDRDADSSGAYDLHDQIQTLFEGIESIRTCINRSLKIVPDSTERD